MDKKFYLIIPVAALAFFIFLHSQCRAADEVPEKINAIIGEPLDQPSGRAMNAIWKEIFRRAGVNDFTATFYPAKRATSMLVSGRADIDLWRVENYDQILLESGAISKRDQVIMIPESIYRCTYRAYSGDPSIISGFSVNSFESFRGTSYKVECRQGYVWVRANLEKVVSSENLSFIKTSEQGLSRLLKGRTQILVSVQEDIESFLMEERFSGRIKCIGLVGSVVAGGWMSGRYTDPKYRPFIMKLSETIRHMKESGEIAAILKKEGVQ